MMEDRELLELAAKAAGMSGCVVDYDDRMVFLEDGKPASLEWNPLTDDGDALRLAVKLRLNLEFFSQGLHVMALDAQPYADDPCAATRRAIVRAAALGRAITTEAGE